MEKGFEKMRENILGKIEKTERNYKLAALGAAIIEFFLIAGFLALADFSDRTHLLLFISTMAIYSIIGAGLLALGFFINKCTLRVIRALQLGEGIEAGAGRNHPASP